MPVISFNNEEFHLAHEEEEKLNQFQMITNFPEEELPDILKLLRNHSWNLEAALGRYFDGTWKSSLEFDQPVGESVPRIPTPVPERSPSPGPFRQEIINGFDGVFARSNFVPSLPIVQALPLNFKDKYCMVGINGKYGSNAWGNLLSGPNTLTIVLMLLPKLLLQLGAGIVYVLWTIISFGFVSNLDSTKKISKVPSQYKPDNVKLKDLIPSLIDSGDENIKKFNRLLLNDIDFNEALKVCKDDFKYLLVIMVGELEDSETFKADVNSQRLISKVLANNEVLAKLEELKDQMVIYTGNVNEMEPWVVAKTMNLKYTPECILIGNVLNSTGSVNGFIRPSVLTKLKINSPKKFLNSLKLCMDKYDPEIIISRNEMQELRLAREIKDLQNQAYEKSLETDRIKEEERQVAEEQEKIEKEIEENKINKIKLSNTANHLLWLNYCIENSDFTTNINLNGNDCATLQMRTSDGKRFIKKFSPSKTLRDIYVDVGSHLYLGDYSNDTTERLSCVRQKIEELVEDNEVLCFKTLDESIDLNEYDTEKLLQLIFKELNDINLDKDDIHKIKINFNLISPFPRYSVPNTREKLVKEISELWPKGSLLVESVDSEDDDNDSDNQVDEDGVDDSDLKV